MLRLLPLLCLLAAPAFALETPVPVDGLLGAYANGEIRTVTLEADLPPDAVVTGLSLQLSGTSMPGLYYEDMDPDQTQLEFWGQFTPYFSNTDPYVFGWANAHATSWNGAVEWHALFGDLHWEFLADGEQEMSVQFIGPYWVGFPVIVRDVSAVITGATAILSHQTQVATEPATWSEVKRLWR